MRGRDRRGVAALEFALIAPALLLIVFGGAEFGLALSEYLTLNNAAVVGAQQFAFSAGVDATPYADAVSAINLAAHHLQPLTIVTSVNGSPCTDKSSTTCGAALSGGSGYVTVQLTYSCAALNIVFNLLPNCTMMVQQTERVQ